MCVFVLQSTFVHTFDVKLGIFSADMERFRLRVCVYVQRESTSFSCEEVMNDPSFYTRK